MTLGDLYAFIASVPADERAECCRHSIPDWELEYLYRLIVERRDLCRGIVEIGTWRGWSGLWLAAAADECGQSFTTVDCDPEAIAVARTLLSRAALPVRYCCGESPGVLRDVTDGQNIWVIDGAHDYEHVALEVAHARQVIGTTQPGLIVLDDARVLHEDGIQDGGVPHVVQEYRRSGMRLLPGTFGRLAMLEVGVWL